jgi:hypothetical protein
MLSGSRWSSVDWRAPAPQRGARLRLVILGAAHLAARLEDGERAKGKQLGGLDFLQRVVAGNGRAKEERTTLPVELAIQLANQADSLVLHGQSDVADESQAPAWMTRDHARLWL